MKNLRIVPKRKFVDSYGTGDSQSYNVYEIRRDFNEDELKFKNGNKINYSKEVLENGVLIETFNSEVNANIFVNALSTKFLKIK